MYEPRRGRATGMTLIAYVAFAALTAGTAHAKAPARPNLKIASNAAPPTVLASDRLLALSARIKNSGRAGARRSVTGFFLSLDSKRSGNDTALGTVTAAALEPGRTTRARRSVTVPAPLAAGTYRLLACADVKKRVRESSERDNCRAAKGTLTIAPPAGAAGSGEGGGGGGTTPGPKPPIADALSLSGTEDGPIAITLIARDPDTCEVTFQIVGQPAHGDLSPIERRDCAPGVPNTDSAAVTYTPDAEYSGPDQFSFRAYDESAISETVVATITVGAANDAPTLTVPANLLGAEDVNRAFPASEIAVADVDAGAASLEVSIAVASGGALALGSTSGLTFTAGDGTDDAAMTFRGALASINTALDGLVLKPSPDHNGTVPVQFSLSDLGNSGPGGTRTAAGTTNVHLSAINDTPVITTPGAQSTAQNTARAFSTAGGNAIALADPDAGTLQVQLDTFQTGSSNPQGTITLSQTTGLDLTAGDGSADTAMVFTGSVADINAALDGVVWTPPNGFTGTGKMNIFTSDEGRAGSGGTMQVADTVMIEVNP